MSPFWVVMTGGRFIGDCHQSRESASKHAEAVARWETGKDVYILASVDKVHVEPAPVIRKQLGVFLANPD